MKKKKIIILSIILVVIIATLIFILMRKESTSEESSTTYKDVAVSKMTIKNTLTSSGEVTSDSIDIELNTYRYYKTLYYSIGDYISSGTKILKYTNGKYYTAPYDLVLVGYNLPESGSRITSMNYLQVKKISNLKMTLSIDETDIGKVAVGQTVDITLNAFEDITYNGKITFINQVGTYSSSGTKYTAIVEFSNDGNIKLGMSGSVSITVEEAKDVIAVPIEAIQTENSKKYVVVVDGDNTSNVEVETGISNDAYVEVKTGLEGTETVRMIETTSTSTGSFGFSNKDRKNMNFEGGNMQMPSGNSNYRPGN